MEIQKGWLFTGAGGKEYYIGQSPKIGKYYKVFSAPNFEQAKAIAKRIVKEYEEQNLKQK